MPGKLAHSPAFIFARLLRALGVATDPSLKQAWPVFDGSEPGEPDEVVTTYTTTGRGQGVLMHDGTILGPQGVVVRVRAATDTVAWAKASDIAEALRTVYDRQVQIETNRYVVESAHRQGDIESLGYDDTARRRIYQANYLANLIPV